MIYITGDTHGDLKRFKQRKIRKLKKDDYLIICGDFGFIWDDSTEEHKRLDFLKKRRYNILFVDGTHENYDILHTYPIVDFCGGKARKISENIYNLSRGSVFTIEDFTFFAFGGGVSPDLSLIIDSGHWYEKENPSDEEFMHGVNELKKVNGKVNFIVTHEPPGGIKKRLSNVDKINDINLYFEEIMKAVKYEQWFFGSAHKNKMISEKLFSVFDDVLPIGNVVKAIRF